MDAVREIDPYHPYYSQYIEQRKAEGKSTSRRIYYYDIIQMSKAVRVYLRSAINQYPDEAITMGMHIAHTVDRARNQFSESHFDSEADAWLAVFVRDLVNAEIRLLLHFM